MPAALLSATAAVLALHAVPQSHLPTNAQIAALQPRGRYGAALDSIRCVALEPFPPKQATQLQPALQPLQVPTADHGGRDGGRRDGRGGGSGGDGDNENSPGDEWFHLSQVLLVPWRLYSTALDRHPLVAKALTAACVGGLGDLCAQKWTDKAAKVDVHRLLAVLFDGLCVSGPGLHAGYAMLERRLPCSGRGSLRNVLAQILIDEAIFDPLFIGAFFFSTGLIERQHPLRDTLPELKREYWPTLRGVSLSTPSTQSSPPTLHTASPHTIYAQLIVRIASCSPHVLSQAMLTSAAFTPVQFYSFRYLPVRYRVLVVNVCDVLWYATVSLGRHSERTPATA